MFSRNRAIAVAVSVLVAIVFLSARGTSTVAPSADKLTPSATDGITIEHPVPLAVF
jgi:cytochrome oxidase Cu insertion factor (SCO1/SenC/PrrC family)